MDGRRTRWHAAAGRPGGQHRRPASPRPAPDRVARRCGTASVAGVVGCVATVRAGFFTEPVRFRAVHANAVVARHLVPAHTEVTDQLAGLLPLPGQRLRLPDARGLLHDGPDAVTLHLTELDGHEHDWVSVTSLGRGRPGRTGRGRRPRAGRAGVRRRTRRAGAAPGAGRPGHRRPPARRRACRQPRPRGDVVRGSRPRRRREPGPGRRGDPCRRPRRLPPARGRRARAR